MLIEKKCPKCGESKLLTPEFWFRNRTTKDGYNERCKPCWLAYTKARGRHDSPAAIERRRKRCSDYQQREWPKVHAKQREWRENNRERFNGGARQRHAANPEPRRKYGKRYVLDLKLAAFDAYGGRFCNCCGETNTTMLTLDHIYNDGYEFRKTEAAGRGTYKWVRDNDYPPVFQVLCWNCNLGKHYDASKICPHQHERLSLVVVAQQLAA